MPFVCLDCFEIYEDNISLIENQKGNIMCPKKTCYGKVVEVDELILPTILLLNKKGYRTRYCCSGHTYLPLPQNCYIMFEEGRSPQTIPPGFRGEFDYACQAYIIRKIFKPITFNGIEIDLIEDMFNTASDLYKWAKELPESPYLEDIEDE
jgi:hypothetical protein